MLTKNFYSYMRAALQNTSAEFIQTNGTTKSIGINSGQEPPFSAMKKWSGNVSANGVCFGTGTTPATTSDYCLESILGSTRISVSVPSAVSFSQGSTFDEYSVGFGVTNTTDEEITISEVGLIATPYYTFASQGSTVYYVLVDRTLLDVPVTIPAHETKHIAYTIRFNYGDAV